MARKPRETKTPTTSLAVTSDVALEEAFESIVRLIDAAQQRAHQPVNTALMALIAKYQTQLPDRALLQANL